MHTKSDSMPRPIRRVSVDDGQLWLWEDGSYAPVVRGGDGEEPDPDPTVGADGKITQEEVKRIAAKEKREGKTAGRRDLLKELGLETEDDLKQILADRAEAEERTKSELDKEREKLAAERQTAVTEGAAARKDRFDARCERALIRAGVSEKIVEKAIKLLDLDSNEELELEDFVEAAKALKEEMPQLFDTGGDEGSPHSDPGKPPKPKSGEKSAKEQAADIFARNHPKPVSTGGGS